MFRWREVLEGTGRRGAETVRMFGEIRYEGQCVTLEYAVMHRYVTGDISTRHTPAMAAMRRAWSALRAPRGLRSFTPAIKGFRAGNFISVPGTRLRPMSSAAESLVEVKGATPEPEKVRGLSCAEAIAQMKLSDRPKAKFVEKVIAAAITNGINNFNMDAERLYV
eukprot:1356535-Amorphochlora_amoeboformis.AAC.1